MYDQPYSSRQVTLTSLLWKVWLWVPMRLRMAIYHIFLRMNNETSSFRAFRLPFDLYAKYGPHVPAVEPFATQYVSLNTTIPTPTVLDVCKDSGGVFFLMTTVPGRSFSMDGVILHSMSDEQVFVFGETLRS